MAIDLARLRYFVAIAMLRLLHGDFRDTASGLNLLRGVKALLDGLHDQAGSLNLQECGLSDEKSGA